MKKVFTFVAASMLALSFASCTSVEDKAKGYADDMKEAIKEGDFEKIEKIASESAEWYEGLSDEDKKIADKAMLSDIF